MSLVGSEKSKGDQKIGSEQVVTETAPGKIILFGEHAVVYGRPALAVPVLQVQAVCRVEAGTPDQGLEIIAADLDQLQNLQSADDNDPLVAVIRRILTALSIETIPDLNLTITSTIPIARGLGSGAAVSTAVVKALARYFERDISLQTVSELVFEVEKLHHGTPSGIDNSVVAFAQPIFFVKGRPIRRLKVASPLTFIIADTGVKSPTHKVVGDLRQRRNQDVDRYEGYFDEIAVIALQARVAVEQGFLASIGSYMTENHKLLDRLGVSSPLLNSLVDTALSTGALGAKLSGAGWGGNMIALTHVEAAENIARALRQAGAVDTIITQIQPV